MPLFEIDPTRPLMLPAPGSGTADELVESNIDALIGEQVFTVSIGQSPDEPHMLAIDASGAPVVIELVERLDLPELFQALDHAGAAGRMTRAQLGGRYPGGMGQFQGDITEFYNHVPMKRQLPGSGARLIIVCREADPLVLNAVDFLRQPSIPLEVLVLDAVDAADGRRFIDVSPLVIEPSSAPDHPQVVIRPHEDIAEILPSQDVDTSEPAPGHSARSEAESLNLDETTDTEPTDEPEPPSAQPVSETDRDETTEETPAETSERPNYDDVATVPGIPIWHPVAEPTDAEPTTGHSAQSEAESQNLDAPTDEPEPPSVEPVSATDRDESTEETPDDPTDTETTAESQPHVGRHSGAIAVPVPAVEPQAPAGFLAPAAPAAPVRISTRRQRREAERASNTGETPVTPTDSVTPAESVSPNAEPEPELTPTPIDGNPIVPSEPQPTSGQAAPSEEEPPTRHSARSEAETQNLVEPTDPAPTDPAPEEHPHPLTRREIRELRKSQEAEAATDQPAAEASAAPDPASITDSVDIEAVEAAGEHPDDPSAWETIDPFAAPSIAIPIADESEPDDELVQLAQHLGEATPLVWDRPRRGKKYSAMLFPDGVIVTDTGARYRHPDTAARAVSGSLKADGWDVWRLGGPTGPSLRDSYRVRFA